MKSSDEHKHRVSRLLLLLQCYHLGFEVGRYISLERLIEQNKERYYETLEHSSQDWHAGKHDPWPYINYLLSIFKMAYQEFEERLGRIKSPRGAKTDLKGNTVTGGVKPKKEKQDIDSQNKTKRSQAGSIRRVSD